MVFAFELTVKNSKNRLAVFSSRQEHGGRASRPGEGGEFHNRQAKPKSSLIKGEKSD
jgi:hypothetical protein